MDIFGIVLTPGHIIVATLLLIAYDAFWTWVMKNTVSDWWFERLQGFLKTGIYLGCITLVVLVVYTPWPYNLVLALSATLSIVFIGIWIKKRKNDGGNQDEESEEEIGEDNEDES